MKTYGLIWAYTKEQNENRQLIALRKTAVPEANLFAKKLADQYRWSVSAPICRANYAANPCLTGRPWVDWLVGLCF